jgi:hypothetical protein
MRDLCCIAEQPAPTPHLARLEGRVALTHMWPLLCTTSAALASFFRMDSISTSYNDYMTKDAATTGVPRSLEIVPPLGPSITVPRTLWGP